MALVKVELNGKRIITVDSRTILEVAREVGIDGIPVPDVDALQRRLGADAISRPLPGIVVRGNSTHALSVTPRESPPRPR